MAGESTLDSHCYSSLSTVRQVLLSDAGVHVLSFLPAARLELLALCCRELSPEYAARYESGDAADEELGAVDAGARLQVLAHRAILHVQDARG